MHLSTYPEAKRGISTSFIILDNTKLRIKGFCNFIISGNTKLRIEVFRTPNLALPSLFFDCLFLFFDLLIVNSWQMCAILLFYVQ